MEQRLRGAIKAIQGVKIPDLPKEIMELDSALSSKFPNNQQITEIIESNTKLSGEVIRIVNSPVMKLKTPVKSIREAVDVLGYNNLKNLVLSAALQNLFNTREVQEIIEHSKDTAFCCAELSEYVHGVSRDEAYLLGLFHNGGCLLLATKDPENYLKVFSLINTNPVSGVKKEVERYGSAHTDIGILIGQKWKLPVEMLNVIMLHHMSHSNIGQEKVRGMMAMVKIANVIVNEVSFGAYMTEEARQYLAEAQEELMLSDDAINELRRVLIGST
jgi:HD-like signal output (HDOD) protein